ncbi:MAG: VanZ family protein [Clostridia bacterium]|nr:VanZ family protein [Clostridia bacterium]
MKIKIAAVVVSVVGWLGFIFTNSLKSRAESANQSAWLEALARKLAELLGFSGNGVNFTVIVRKAAHVFEFYLLCLLLYWIFNMLIKNKRAVNVLAPAVTLAAAAVDESLQIISDRGASVKDVLVDGIGILLAYLTVKIIIKVKSKRIETNR